MEIRSITYFIHPGQPLENQRLAAAGRFLQQARQAFEADGYQVQTTRLATIPFAKMLAAATPEETLAGVKQLEEICRAAGIDYLSVGPALPEYPHSYELVPDILGSTSSVFASAQLTTPKGVSQAAVQASGRIIQALTRHEANGFGNLYFAALANVPPGAPFFPAAYHAENEPPAFALALEAADLAVAAFQSAASLQAARTALLKSLQTHAQQLASTAGNLASRHGLAFKGLDFTLAPFPTDQRSLGTAFECLGVAEVGLPGTIAAAAFLTSILDEAEFPRTGFNGLMLPVLEDSVLAARAASGSLTVNDLLLYSAVCGTGLDTIPLPGDTTAEALAAVLLDLAALAQRLDKPLTARLMPIPGKRAGDPTEFDFPYFANSRVMAINHKPLTAPLLGQEPLVLRPRSKAKI